MRRNQKIIVQMIYREFLNILLLLYREKSAKSHHYSYQEVHNLSLDNHLEMAEEDHYLS